MSNDYEKYARESEARQEKLMKLQMEQTEKAAEREFKKSLSDGEANSIKKAGDSIKSLTQ